MVILAFLGLLCLIAIIMVIGFSLKQSYEKFFGGIKSNDDISVKSTDTQKILRTLAIISKQAEELQKAIDDTDVSSIPAGDVEKIGQQSQKISGKLAGVKTALVRKIATGANPSNTNENSVFGDLKDKGDPKVVVTTAANLCGIYGNDAADRFLQKAAKVDASIKVGDYASFARLPQDRRRAICNNVKTINMVL